MSQENYFVICNSDGDTTVNVYTQATFEQALNEGELGKDLCF